MLYVAPARRLCLFMAPKNMPSYQMPVFAPLPVAFTHGDGAWLWDTQGKKYLDALAGSIGAERLLLGSGGADLFERTLGIVERSGLAAEARQAIAGIRALRAKRRVRLTTEEILALKNVGRR